jgi:hypothetical protein
MENIPESLKNLPYDWEINPKYDVPHLGPYVYIKENGHITMQQTGPGCYMEEDKDDK